MVSRRVARLVGRGVRQQLALVGHRRRQRVVCRLRAICRILVASSITPTGVVGFERRRVDGARDGRLHLELRAQQPRLRFRRTLVARLVLRALLLARLLTVLPLYSMHFRLFEVIANFALAEFFFCC